MRSGVAEKSHANPAWWKPSIRPSSCAAVFAGIVAGSFAATDERAPSSPVVELADSAGVEIATVMELPSLDDPAYECASAITREVSGFGDDPAGKPLFYDPRDVTGLKDGTLVVSDRGEYRWVVLGPDGAVLRRFGRYGRGPCRRCGTRRSCSAVIVAFTIVTGCAAESKDMPILSDDAAAEVVHPQEDDDPPVTSHVDPAKQVEPDREETGNTQERRLVRLGNARITRSIGQFEGEDGAVFGLIADARTDPRGRVYVLDGQFERIAVYDEGGTLLGTYGRPGRGPGEFREPGGLAWREGQLLALDVGNMRIHVYDVLPDGLELATMIRLPFMARSFCTIGSRIYLGGLYEGKTVHEIDMTGQIFQSFGDGYPGEEMPAAFLRSNVQSIMSNGLVACSRDPDRGVAIPRNRPEVTAYSPEGDVIWRTTLSGYSQLQMSPTDRGTLQLGGDPRTGGQHTAQGIVIWPPDYVLAQLAYLSPSGHRSRDEAPPETRVLSLDTGEELATLPELNRIVEISDGRALGFRNLPFPQVLYHAL